MSSGTQSFVQAAIIGSVAMVGLMVIAAGPNASGPVGEQANIEFEPSAAWINSPAIRSADLSGRVVVLEFWATWCPPCRGQIPHMNKLHDQYTPRGVKIVAVTNENAGKVQPFAQQAGIRYPVLANSRLASAFGVLGIPHAVVLDRTGKIVYSGYPDGEMDAAVEKALAS